MGSRDTIAAHASFWTAILFSTSPLAAIAIEGPAHAAAAMNSIDPLPPSSSIVSCMKQAAAVLQFGKASAGLALKFQYVPGPIPCREHKECPADLVCSGAKTCTTRFEAAARPGPSNRRILSIVLPMIGGLVLLVAIGLIVGTTLEGWSVM